MSEPSLARPPALRPGDRVAVLGISSPADAPRLAVGLDALRFAGLEPVVFDSALDPGSQRPYLAGSDEMRAGDLRRALLDPQIKGILLARGGSGSQRTLAALDWAGLDRVAPKVLAGYSDVTAALEAVARRLGWASLLSPMVTGSDPHAHYSWGSFLRSLMAPERATHLDFADATTIVGGLATGRTAGGNLTVLTASIGTDTSWPAHGAILLLEEVEEEDYRIDRMLTHLHRAGYLDGVAGIVTGTFQGCEPAAIVADILIERLAPLGVPMISGANVGHGGRVQTWPIGIAAELDADAGRVRLLDPPLVPVAG